MAMRRILLASVCAALGLGLLAGCTGSEESTPPSTTSPTTTTDPALRFSPTVLVEVLSLGDGDVGPDEHVQVLAQGEPEGKAEPSLAYCNYELTTEATRIVRHQVAIVGVDGVVATNDAVLYSTDGAIAALQEFRGGIEQCETGVVVPEDRRFPDDAPPTTSDSTPLDDGDTAGLTEDRVAMTVSSTRKGQPTETEVTIVQRRGAALVITFSPDKVRALELARRAADRLAETDSVYFKD